MSRANTQRLYAAFISLLLIASLATTVAIARAQEWQSLELFALLLASERLRRPTDHHRSQSELSAAFVALVLAITLLGPVPAVCIGMALGLSDGIARKIPFANLRTNLCAYATCFLVGGLLTRLLVGDVHDPHRLPATRGITFGLLVFGIYLIANLINFMLIALHKKVLTANGLFEQVRYLFMPLLPGQVAAAALTALLAVAYTNLGYPALLGLVLAILIFQYLLRALVRSEDRAEQLEARSMRLASLQLGVLVTLVETLALRDRMTARHAAAVAKLCPRARTRGGLQRVRPRRGAHRRTAA